MIGNQAVNDMAQKTLLSALHVARVYAVSARPVIVRAGINLVIGLSCWLMALALLAFAIHDSIVPTSNGPAIGRMLLWSSLFLGAAILCIRMAIRSTLSAAKQTSS